jgi:uncharacterized protein YbjT (DUF2867 family)
MGATTGPGSPPRGPPLPLGARPRRRRPGTQVVDQLRSRGHTVTAYVRNPSKVPSTWGEDVTVVVGELSDAAAIDRAVQGADAVVSALGPSLSRKATGLPLIEGTRNIVAAMQRHGVRR